MLLIILIVLLVLSVAGGGFGHARYGYVGWSPVGIVLVVLLLCFLTGHVRF